jgi:hypothetical protein
MAARPAAAARAFRETRGEKDVNKHAGILGLILMVLAGAAGGAAAQTITQVSTLTSTTTGEVLQLQAVVAPVPGTNRFDWRFELTNPAGNTVRIDTFTVAPRTSLEALSSVRSPMGWYAASTAGPDPRIIWRWLADNPTTPTNVGGQLDAGETFVFEFELGQGGASGAGEALASGSAAFAGPSPGAGGAGGPGGPPGVIPEPGTLCLLGTGLVPLVFRRRRLPRSRAGTLFWRSGDREG